MRDNLRPLIEDGRKRYGTSIHNEESDPDMKNAACAICGVTFPKWPEYSDHVLKKHERSVFNRNDTCTCGCDSQEHTYGTAECQSCDCKKFKLKNDSSVRGFTYCVTCDESIAQSRIEEHKKDGHKIEIVGDGGIKNETELGPFSAPGMKNNVDEGRKRYGRKII